MRGLLQRILVQRRRLLLSLIVGTATGTLVLALASIMTTGLDREPGSSSVTVDGWTGADLAVDPSGAVAAATGPGDPERAGTVGVDPATAAGAELGSGLAADRRILALDRRSVRLPVRVGDVVELVGLTPTATSMRSEVIATEARVVGVDDGSILLDLDAGAAHRAGEVAAVGDLQLLGRRLPPTDPGP